jgi:hypothetical protein
MFFEPHLHLVFILLVNVFIVGSAPLADRGDLRLRAHVADFHEAIRIGVGIKHLVATVTAYHAHLVTLSRSQFMARISAAVLRDSLGDGGLEPPPLPCKATGMERF